MDLSILTVNTVLAFVLLLTRVSGMMLSAPLFGNNSIPALVKVGMAVTISLILFPLHAGAKDFVVPTDMFAYTVIALQELVVGLLIGFAANMIFSGIQLAGEHIGVQMGVSVASILNPETNTQVPILGQFFFIFAILIFLSLNIHHGLIVAVHQSFAWIPLGHGIEDVGHLTERFIRYGGNMFLIAIMISMPIMGILLITEISLGFVAKVMPQMNIFMVGLPLKVGVGVLVLYFSLPFTASFLGEQYALLIQQLMILFKT